MTRAPNVPFICTIIVFIQALTNALHLSRYILTTATLHCLCIRCTFNTQSVQHDFRKICLKRNTPDFSVTYTGNQFHSKFPDFVNLSEWVPFTLFWIQLDKKEIYKDIILLMLLLTKLVCKLMTVFKMKLSMCVHEHTNITFRIAMQKAKIFQ